MSVWLDAVDSVGGSGSGIQWVTSSFVIPYLSLWLIISFYVVLKSGGRVLCLAHFHRNFRVMSTVLFLSVKLQAFPYPSLL